MTQKNRENMHRAIGIVVGISWVTDEKTSEALTVVYEILEEVLNTETEDQQ